MKKISVLLLLSVAHIALTSCMIKFPYDEQPYHTQTSKGKPLLFSYSAQYNLPQNDCNSIPLQFNSTTMETLEILILAIQQKKQISYEYESEGRAIGVRIGNPHAIFTAKTENVNIDIYKIDGVKTDLTKSLPAWRQYKTKHISNVKILDAEFLTADGYNPTSKQYIRTIEKIENID